MLATVSTASVCDKITAAFPFTVDKLPLYGPETLRTPHYGLFRSDNAECVGVACRQGYVPHTVDDICALAEAAVGAFQGESEVRCLWHGDGHHVTIAPSREYRQSVFGTTDNVWPRMIIDASYDGCAFTGSLGLYRDACRNMSIIRSAGQSVGAKIKHTHHLRERLAELRETFAGLAARWTGVVATARRMDAVEVDLASFIRTVYPVSEDATKRTRDAFHRRTEQIVRRIMRERLAIGRRSDNIGRATAWEAFNGVQGYVQHDMSRHGRPSEFARALLSLHDSAVQRAEEHALALAS